MNKQLNLFVDNSQLTPLEKETLKKEHEQQVRKCLGIEEEIKKKKKPNVLDVDIDRYVRTERGIFKVRNIIGQIVIMEDVENSRRISNALISHIVWVAKHPYDLLMENDFLYIRLDNGAIRENFVYKVMTTKKGERKFLVEDKADGEVICIDYSQILKIKEVVPLWIF